MVIRVSYVNSDWNCSSKKSMGYMNGSWDTKIPGHGRHAVFCLVRVKSPTTARWRRGGRCCKILWVAENGLRLRIHICIELMPYCTRSDFQKQLKIHVFGTTCPKRHLAAGHGCWVADCGPRIPVLWLRSLQTSKSTQVL